MAVGEGCPVGAMGAHQCCRGGREYPASVEYESERYCKITARSQWPRPGSFMGVVGARSNDGWNVKLAQIRVNPTLLY